jgi:cytidine deaminase
VSLTESERELVERARAALEGAYAPYSEFRVGAAVRTRSGKIYTGANVENASYGLCVCAERIAVFQAVNDGERELAAVAVVTSDPSAAHAPCGACRQVLDEFAAEDMVVLLAPRTGEAVRRSFRELLPAPFRFS